MTGSGIRPGAQRLCAGGPLDFGQHGAGFLTGAGVHEVVAEEDLRRSCHGTLPNHQLHTVAAACGYDLTRHHHALADAEACAAIAMKLL